MILIKLYTINYNFILLVTLCPKKDTNEVKKRRRRDKTAKDEEQCEDEEMTEVEPEEQKITTVTDGVFTITINSSSGNPENCINSEGKTNESNIFLPPPRMNSGLTIKNGHLYLFGGLVEDGDKQLTLADMYSLGSLNEKLLLNLHLTQLNPLQFGEYTQKSKIIIGEIYSNSFLTPPCRYTQTR